MVGEVHLAGVAGDQGVEVGDGPSPPLGRRIRPSRWASSWRLPKVPETWIITLASGRSMAKLPTFESTIRRTSPVRNSRYKILALVVARLAGDQGRSNRSAIRRSCLRYWPMTRTRSSGPSCRSRRRATRSSLAGSRWPGGTCRATRRRRSPSARPEARPIRTSWQRASAIQPFCSRTRQGTSYFLGPIRLKTSSSRPSSRTSVAVSPEPSPGLDLGRDPEDGRRQEVDLVVDDQAPVALVEQLEVGEVAVLLGPIGDDLVRRQRHRGDRLGFAGVGRDHRLVEVGLVEDLATPLLDRRGAGGQDEGVLAQGGQRGDADDRLAGAARQDDHAGPAPDVAAGVEGVDGHPLVVADLERVARGRLVSRKVDLQRSPLRCSRPGPRPGSRRRSGLA